MSRPMLFKIFLLLCATAIHFVALHFLDTTTAAMIFIVAMLGVLKLTKLSNTIFYSVLALNLAAGMFLAMQHVVSSPF